MSMVGSKTGMKWGMAGAVIGAVAAWSSGASAQMIGDNPPVDIRNKSGETRKVCFHKDKEITLFAIGCVELKDGENIFWNREGVFTSFKVKVYQKRKLLDTYLYTRWLPNDTGRITIGTGQQIGFSRFESIGRYFSVWACNSNYDAPIYLALGLDYGDKMVSEGWWNVARGECKLIPITKRAKDNWNIRTSNIPRVYYYARTYGDTPLYWKGGDNERVFCLNPGKRFKGYLGGGRSCASDAEGQPYRFLVAPNLRNEPTIPLTF